MIQKLCFDRSRVVVHETDFWCCLRHGFKAERDHRTEMPANVRDRDAQGSEIGGVKGAFLAPSANGDDAAEGLGVADEGEEVGDETEAGIVVQ